MFVWFLYPKSYAHHLCVLEDFDGHVKLMGRPNMKVTIGVTKEDAQTVVDQSLEKDAP